MFTHSLKSVELFQGSNLELCEHHVKVRIVNETFAKLLTWRPLEDRGKL